jgi:DNA-binding GntR family transcriptional regulator
MQPVDDAGKGIDDMKSSGRDASQTFLGVHSRLRAAILTGQIQAGATTSQAALVNELGVGRTPLREALRMLQREGLVTSEPNHRVRIAELSTDDVEELYLMRITLEAIAVRTTVLRLTPTDFAELEGFMAQMAHYARHDNSIGYRVPHSEFHQRLVSGAGSRVSAEIAELFDHAERYRRRFGGEWQDRADEHRAILDAVAAEDSDRAVELLVRHYLHTVRRVFDVMDPAHPLDRLRTAVAVIAPDALSSL